MTWTLRTIAGDFVGPDGEPIVGATITAKLMAAVAADGDTVALPDALVSVTTDGDGAAALPLLVPETGTAQYLIKLPRATITVNLGAGAETTFAALLTATTTAVEQDAITTAIDAHTGAANPHPVYLTEAEGDVRYAAIGGGGGATAWDDVTDTPVTLAGYGITDAATSAALAAHEALTTAAHGGIAPATHTHEADDLPARPAALVPLIIANISSVSWTNQPAEAQEFNGGGTGRRLRRRADLTGNTRCRLSGYATGSGPSGCVWGVEYTTDATGATGWAALGDSGAAVEIPMDATSSDAPIVGSIVTLAAAARADVLLRVVGAGGNDSAAPAVSSLLLELLP